METIIIETANCHEEHGIRMGITTPYYIYKRTKGCEM